MREGYTPSASPIRPQVCTCADEPKTAKRNPHLEKGQQHWTISAKSAAETGKLPNTRQRLPSYRRSSTSSGATKVSPVSTTKCHSIGEISLSRYDVVSVAKSQCSPPRSSAKSTLSSTVGSPRFGKTTTSTARLETRAWTKPGAKRVAMNVTANEKSSIDGSRAYLAITTASPSQSGERSPRVLSRPLPSPDASRADESDRTKR